MAKIVKEYSEYVLDEYPKTCVECPFFRMYQKIDMGAFVDFFDCMLDYTANCKNLKMFDFVDREDFKYKRWDGCKIEENPSVYLEEE